MTISYSNYFSAAEDIKKGDLVSINKDGNIERARSTEEIMRKALERIASGMIPGGTCACIAKEALERIK